MKTYTEEEVRLLMKEQAKIVRHAAYDHMMQYVAGGFNDPMAKIQKEMMNLQHDWAINPKKIN